MFQFVNSMRFRLGVTLFALIVMLVIAIFGGFQAVQSVINVNRLGDVAAIQRARALNMAALSAQIRSAETLEAQALLEEELVTAMGVFSAAQETLRFGDAAEDLPASDDQLVLEALGNSDTEWAEYQALLADFLALDVDAEIAAVESESQHAEHYVIAVDNLITALDNQENISSETINSTGRMRAIALSIGLDATQYLNAPSVEARADSATDMLVQVAAMNVILAGLQEGSPTIDRVTDVVALSQLDVVLNEWILFEADTNTLLGNQEDVNSQAILLRQISTKSEEQFTASDAVVSALDADVRSVEQATLERYLILGGFIVVVVLLTLFIITQFNRNISGLQTAATALADGDLSVRAPERGLQEIATVGAGFNQMAAQLGDLVGNLEGTVAERTRDLETITAVNAQISSILDVDRLLQDVVDLTKERFGLYHAHVYMLDDDGVTLTLAAGAGHVGRQMVSDIRQISLRNRGSLVARSAREQESIPVADVAAAEDFLPHPLLPQTASELATPLVARNQLLGVLDVQSNEVGYFDEATVDMMELLAGQISVALSNARLFEATERTSRHQQAVGNITRRVQDAVDIEDLLELAVRELGRALRVPYTAIELKIDPEEVAGLEEVIETENGSGGQVVE